MVAAVAVAASPVAASPVDAAPVNEHENDMTLQIFISIYVSV
jgi:hypothetical protein